MRFEGERVIVRSCAEGDALAYLSYFDRNRAHLEPWEPAHDATFYTETYWQERMRSNIADRARGTNDRMVIFEKPDETVIAGMISLMSVMARAPVWNARIGYSLDRTKEGRGLMSEALALIVRYAFEDLNLKRLLAGFVPYNSRSASVLERAGFVRDCYLREYLYVGGAWQDHVDTSLVNPHWRVP